jgi:methanogenic corrinoid protein MtbC1
LGGQARAPPCKSLAACTIGGESINYGITTQEQYWRGNLAEELYEVLRSSILVGDRDQAAALARELVIADSDIEHEVSVASRSIREVGDRFQEGECYLPELVLSAEAV